MIDPSDEAEQKAREYRILSMVMNGNELSLFADDCKDMANNFASMTPEEQAIKFEELSPYASKPVPSFVRERRFANLLGVDVSALYQKGP